MKLQATVITAFLPAALAAASISLAFVLLPGSTGPAHSAGLAPALRSVAGNVVAAVAAPVRTITKQHRHRKSVVPRAATPVPTAVSTQRATPVAGSTSPAQRRHAAHRQVLRPPTVTPTHVAAPAVAPAATLPSAQHGRGKAKALGHLKQAAPKATHHPAAQASRSAQAGQGKGKALGHPADTPHGPPAVPPGQAKKTAPGPSGPAADHSRGGVR